MDNENLKSTETSDVKDDDPVEKYTKIALKGNPVKVPIKFAKQVQNRLETLKAQAIEQEDYMLAQKIEDACKEIGQKKQIQSYSNRQKSRIQELELKVIQAKQDLDDKTQKIQEITDKYNKEKKESLEKFEADKQKELDDYTNKMLQNIPSSYQKNSWEYLQLRKQEEFLVSSKRYVEANDIKKEADKLEAEERARQEELWKQHVMTLRQAYAQKIENQRKCLIQSWEQKWNLLQPSAQMEIKKAIKAVKVAEANLSVAQSDTTLPPLHTSSPLKPNEFRIRQTNYANMNTHKLNNPRKSVRSSF